MRRLAARDRTCAPWRNGHGQTALVATGERWRLSIAEIADDSPFSAFDGCERRLMPLCPAPVVLEIDGRRRVCEPLVACAFSGEAAVRALDVTDPVQVLNLIFERGTCRGWIDVVRCAGATQLRGDGLALLAVAVADGLMTEDGERLARGDALWLHNGEVTTLTGRSELAVARLRAT